MSATSSSDSVVVSSAKRLSIGDSRIGASSTGVSSVAGLSSAKRLSIGDSSAGASRDGSSSSLNESSSAGSSRFAKFSSSAGVSSAGSSRDSAAGSSELSTGFSSGSSSSPKIESKALSIVVGSSAAGASGAGSSSSLNVSSVASVSAAGASTAGASSTGVSSTRDSSAGASSETKFISAEADFSNRPLPLDSSGNSSSPKISPKASSMLCGLSSADFSNRDDSSRASLSSIPSSSGDSVRDSMDCDEKSSVSVVSEVSVFAGSSLTGFSSGSSSSPKISPKASSILCGLSSIEADSKIEAAFDCAFSSMLAGMSDTGVPAFANGLALVDSSGSRSSSRPNMSDRAEDTSELEIFSSAPNSSARVSDSSVLIESIADSSDADRSSIVESSAASPLGSMAARDANGSSAMLSSEADSSATGESIESAVAGISNVSVPASAVAGSDEDSSSNDMSSGEAALPSSWVVSDMMNSESPAAATAAAAAVLSSTTSYSSFQKVFSGSMSCKRR